MTGLHALRRMANGLLTFGARSAVRTTAPYHVARELLIELGFAPSDERDAHRDVRHHLEKSGDQELAKLATFLRNMHSRRKDADYHLHLADVEQARTAQMVVERTRLIIEGMYRRCSSPDKDIIRGCIAKWVAAGKPIS